MGRKTWTEEQEAFIIKNANTMTSKQMGLELGRTEASVQIRLNQMGIKKERPKESFTTAQVAAETKFNRLTVQRTWVEETEQQKHTMGEFLCDCGNKVIAKLTKVKQGNPQSCGCLRDEKARERTIKRNTTHGMSKHGIYSQYQAMMNRCYRPEVNAYDDYGGRGIDVCDEWKTSFEAFAAWGLANGWKKGLTIERKDNEKGYSPANCKWATLTEQANNKRSNRRMSAFGESKTLAQWSRESCCQVSYQVLYDRVTKLGWSLEAALTSPVRPLTKST